MMARRSLQPSYITTDSTANALSTMLNRLLHRVRMLEENVQPVPGGEREGNSIADGTQVTNNYYGYIPIGGIILWSGAEADIPTNWHLCDGTNGTPNLQNRFVVGAGDSYAVAATGGATTKDVSHTHGAGTLATDSDGHSHDVTGTSAAESTHSHELTDTTENCADGADHAVIQEVWVSGTDAHSHGAGTYATDSDSHSHAVDSGSTASGGSATQDIMPPYYALCYIMRVS